MFDADAEPNHIGGDTGGSQFRFGQLAVGGGCGVRGQRFGIADVDQPFEQVERIVKFNAGLKPAFDAKRQQAGGFAVGVFLGQLIVRRIGQAGKANPRHGISWLLR